MKDVAVSIVLPCRNERESVGACLARIRAAMDTLRVPYEIVVSDSSHDGSEKIAREAGAIVVKHDREGYGIALREGFAAAHGETLVYLDADDTYEAEKISALIEMLSHSDLAIGSRLAGTIAPGAMPLLHRYLGTPTLNLLLFLFFGVRVSDSQSGFRALRRRTYDALALRTNGMEFATEMLIKAKRAGLRIEETPVRYGPRKGNSKLRPYHDGFVHLKYILMQAPFSWYVGVGAALFIVGLVGLAFGNALGTFFATATAKILFPFIGIQTFFLGLFAKTYLHIRIGESVAFIPRLYRVFTLKRGLALAAALLLVPAIVRFAGTAIPFDPLLVATLTGLQIAFNSFVLSTLSLK